VDKQAGEQLGEPVVGGCVLQATGTGKRTVIGGLLGGYAGMEIANRMAAKSGSSEMTPAGYRGVLYVAVGATKVGFFGTDHGLKLKELLTVVPRDSVAAFAVGGGMITCPVEIVLADGSHFVLEVQRAQKGKAEKVGALFAH